MTTSPSRATQEQEVEAGERFKFGQNWTQFLTLLNEERIQRAISSLKEMLGVETLDGRSFLDIGSGSGLFSLAAKRLGARVYSFDYDPQSVACTRELKRRYYESDREWQIESGSVLDVDFLQSLGQFDVVYSWGVLHHTGDMWTALANVDSSVAINGKLFIALYNDQGGASRRWTIVKRIYCHLPRFLKFPFAVIVYLPLEIRTFLVHLVRLQPFAYFSHISSYSKNRGMSWWYDRIDWIGGYPFEVSRPEQVFDFYRVRGYRLLRLTTDSGSGCNQFVFAKDA